MARSILFQLIQSQAHHHLAPKNFHSGLHPCRFGTWQAAKAHTHSTSTYLKLSPQFSISQKIFSSQSSTTEQYSKITIGPSKETESKKDEKAPGITYHGPISNTIKKVKLLFLSTCFLSVSLGPVITFMTSPKINVIVNSSVIFLSASTTAALHWFVSPYIHKLRWQPGSDSFEVDLMTWLATFTSKTIKFEDIRMPEKNGTFLTFKANGNLYIVDAEIVRLWGLLARLTAIKSSVQESAFKNL